MIPNPNAKRILCYGDSNTWGQKPDKTGRFAADVRWTGVVQQELGNDFDIIEEGLSSRTTDLEYHRKPGRNGKIYLQACLESQNPLDLVVLMLGTNDFKIEFGPRPTANITAAIKGLVTDIKKYGYGPNDKPPHIALISPIHVNGKATYFTEYYAGYYDDRSVEISLELAAHLKQLASDSDCYFFDASTVARAGSDGIHMSRESHQALGQVLAALVMEWVK